MNILQIEWLLYYWRWLFSVLELDARYDWQVMAPNTHRSVFPISHLCILTCIAWKLHVIYGHSAYWMTALLLETFLEWFRVAWEIWLESYGPRHALVILSHNIVCVYCKPVHTQQLKNNRNYPATENLWQRKTGRLVYFCFLTMQ